jgi:hypothetical protein
MSYRVISSAQTWAMKFVGPAGFILGAAFFAGMFYFGLFAELYRAMFEGGLSPALIDLFWGMWCLGTLFTAWWGYRLKRVAVDGDSIYISDYFQEAKLPLSDILKVSENRWIQLHPITVEFAGRTPWGHYIKFMPKIRIFVPQWFSHPIVPELRDMVYWARADQRVTDKLQQDSLEQDSRLKPNGLETIRR